MRGLPTSSSSSVPPPGKFQSAAWAEWAPGLVSAICQAWESHVQQGLEVSPEYALSRQEALHKLTDGQWAEHLRSDDIPYRADYCAVCIGAASRDRPHCLRSRRHLFQLSADVAGPFKPGIDFGGSQKYFMVYSIQIPVGADGDWMAPLAEGAPDPNALGPSPVIFLCRCSCKRLQYRWCPVRFPPRRRNWQCPCRGAVACPFLLPTRVGPCRPRMQLPACAHSAGFLPPQQCL